MEPSALLEPKVGWWYNWYSAGSSTHAEFVPMIWGETSLDAELPAGSQYLLGFNEPNFGAQADLTPAEAAGLWPSVEAIANQAGGLTLVSPAVNYCGGDCNGENPVQYLRDFFAACTNCKVDHIAVHWYNCDVPSLTSYLDSFAEFGKPIWLTEFACAYGGDTSAAGQQSYMEAAIPYLEQNPNVFRYAWFSADPIPEARLMNENGSLTPLGEVYASLPGGCQ